MGGHGVHEYFFDVFAFRSLWFKKRRKNIECLFRGISGKTTIPQGRQFLFPRLVVIDAPDEFEHCPAGSGQGGLEQFNDRNQVEPSPVDLKHETDENRFIKTSFVQGVESIFS